MTIAEKLTVVAQNEQKVFDAGYQKGIAEDDSADAFWDAYQQNGTRTNYTYAFYGWSADVYAPKYPLLGTVSGCFIGATITDAIVEIKTSFTKKTTTSAIFQNCQSLKNIPYLEISPYADLRTSNFENCFALETLTVGGTINSNNFDVHWSEKLTHDSLMSIIYSLADKTTDLSDTVWVCTLGTVNLEKLTNEEIALATGKGWILT